MAAAAVVAIFIGCAGRYYMVVSRYVERSLARNAPEQHIARCWARVHMGWLEAEVTTNQADSTYRSDFVLETASASAITLAISRSERVFEPTWDSLHLTTWCHYGEGLRWFGTYGLYKLTMDRATLEEIRLGTIAPESIASRWVRLVCVKQGPHGEVLEWPAGAAEPVRRNMQ